MILADYVEYKTFENLNQEGPTCSTHATLVAIAERVQQTTGLNLKFDYVKEYERMLKWREAWRKKDPRFSSYIPCLLEIGRTEGFKALTGQTVLVRGSLQVNGRTKEEKIDKMCRELQANGPLLFGVRMYEGHSLTKVDGSGRIARPKEGSKQKENSHVMTLIGFDRVARLFRWQNSWGDRTAIRDVSFDDLLCTVNGEPWMKYVYSIRSAIIAP